MYSAKGHPTSLGWGCPIRTSPDHSLLAAPRGLSQPSTSFIGSWCQGIHRAPLLARRLDLSNSPSRQDQRSQKKTLLVVPSPNPARVRAIGLYLSAQLLFDSSGTHPALLRAPVVALPPGKPHGQSVEAPRLALQFVPVLSRLVVCARRHKNGPTLSSRCGTHENSAANPMRLASPTV
jgi:hypothetical protein